MIDYPENLPLPSTSFDREMETPVIRTEMATGLIEQEGRFSTAKRTHQASWKLSQAEFQIFEEWFTEDLVGGCLVFGMTLPVDGALEVVPVRFIGGSYEASHDGGLWFSVSASFEHLSVENAPTNRTLAVPMWKRLEIDPMDSQVLTLSHRNALLVTDPDFGSVTTLRIFPPTSKSAYIYFGIQNVGLGDVLITNQDVDPIPTEPSINFPAGLPGIDQAFSQTARQPVSRLEMDSGHSRQWSRFDFNSKTYNVQWEFDFDELQEFQDFFFITLESGSHPFSLALPVDGVFIPVPVRFAGGSYKESYVGVNRFKITAQVDRMVDQTVLPEVERPFPLYYSPQVNVTAHRKVLAGDAMKFFVVNPALGETINLHIYSLEIEFGVLVKGLGNVLITRGPFLLDVGDFADEGSGVFEKPAMELIDVTEDVGSFTDGGEGAFQKPSFDIVDVTEDVGDFADEGSGVFSKPAHEILDVLVDVGDFADEGSGVFSKPSLTLDIP